MKYRNISHFADGEVASPVRGAASLNSLLESQNVRVHTGGAVPRPGQKYLDDDDLSPDDDINSLYEYSREYWDSVEKTHGVVREYIFAAGSGIYGWWVGSDDVFELNEEYPSSSDDIWIAEYKDYAYIANGVDPLYKYDGVNYFQVGVGTGDGSVTGEPPDLVITRGSPDATDPFQGFRKYKYRYVRAIRSGGGELIEYHTGPFSDESYSPDFRFSEMDLQYFGSDDPQVTHIEIYCTEVYDSYQELNGATYYRLDFDLTYALPWYDGIINADGTFVDTYSNAQLSQNAELHPEHDPATEMTAPPIGLNYLIYFKDRLYGVPRANPSIVKYSDIGEPEHWPLDNWVDIRRDDGDVITGFAVLGNSLYIFKNRSIWIMTGDPEATPILEVLAGGERVGTQTEFGLGCTAPRTIATHTDSILIFYSRFYGVYMIESGVMISLSRGIGNILNLDDLSSAVIYSDIFGEIFYVISSPTGNARVCHVATRKWVSDTNTNVPCFCVDSNGYILGGYGKKINRFYHPDYDTDNSKDVISNITTAWLNLRSGEYHAVVRKILVQAQDLHDPCAITLHNENNDSFSTTIDGTRRGIGISGISGRLFSLSLTWTKATIESITYLYRWRRGH